MSSKKVNVEMVTGGRNIKAETTHRTGPGPIVPVNTAGKTRLKRDIYSLFLFAEINDNASMGRSKNRMHIMYTCTCQQSWRLESAKMINPTTFPNKDCESLELPNISQPTRPKETHSTRNPHYRISPRVIARSTREGTYNCC
jgi:hypothetical protein